MVDTHQLPPASHLMLQNVTASLQQLANHTLTSQRLVQLAEDFYWALMEGQYRGDRSPEANRLRETLADITAQWELLVGNLHDQSVSHSILVPEFPPEWVHHWLAQIQSLEQSTMPETPKNQPTFQIQQVGTINTGDVTIHGDQVGIQHNYAVSPELDSTLKDLNHSLNELQRQHPNVKTETQAYDIIEAELITSTTSNANKLVKLMCI